MDPGSIPVHHLTSVKICLLLPSRDWPIFLLYELWIKHFDIYLIGPFNITGATQTPSRDATYPVGKSFQNQHCSL